MHKRKARYFKDGLGGPFPMDGLSTSTAHTAQERQASASHESEFAALKAFNAQNRKFYREQEKVK